MGVDYYHILKVTKSAKDDDLRRAYKKLAIIWHPDKHPLATKPTAEAKFKLICQAYDVLSDSNKRHIYDIYGEEGLIYNVSSPSSVSMNKATSFRFNPRDAEDIFSDIFGDEKIRSDHQKKSSGGGGVTVVSGGGGKALAMENKLTCSLEDLFKGSKRKMKISRIVSDHSGKPETVEEVLAIDIKPGWKKGTKITFPEKGNQEPGLLPGDLIFVIEEKPHPTFKRDGNDLCVHHKLSLLEALTGKTLNLTTLDGRTLNIQVSDIVKPGHEVVIPNEGMPISKEPRKRGNLRIKFDVKFPSKLTTDQKADLKRVLGGRS